MGGPDAGSSFFMLGEAGEGDERRNALSLQIGLVPLDALRIGGTMRRRERFSYGHSVGP